MNGTIRVGIVGCGGIAKGAHVPGYLKTDGADVVALFDPDASRMQVLREELVPEAQDCPALESLLAADVDAVSVCTPNHLHSPVTLAALKAGKHVLCEKPMASRLEDATEMIQAARRADKVLHINQSLHYNVMYRTVHDLVAEGRIGTPVHVRCIRAGVRPPKASWFVSRDCDGGLLLDIGIHMGEYLQWVVGRVAEVAAVVDTRLPDIDVPDNVRSLFRFESGATGVLELSWTFPDSALRLEIYGTEGLLRYGKGCKTIEIQTGAGQDAEIEHVEPVAQDGSSSFGSVGNFCDAIRGTAASATPGELGRDALALCVAMAESSSSRAFVKVPRFE